MTEKFEVLFQDDHVIVVNKPVGWLTIPGRGNKEGVPILSHEVGRWLRAGADRTNPSPDLFVVHRLDQGTSGAMILAKDADTHRTLSHEFEEGHIKKIYWAVVKGNPGNRKIDLPLFKLPSKKNKSVVDPKGKPSQTSIKTIMSSEGYSLIEAELHTGRPHQVRVHLAHEGFPLVGDKLYGGPVEVAGINLEWPQLHSRLIGFSTKAKGQLELIADPNSTMKLIFEQLGWSPTACL
ncbi:MAG: RluA family pseudouridine synthase [Oligoflexia bacterium]|nr:RluA family pseudouridine synthase [Oligoflexia bacterium]